jgi:hypothetical protein
LQIFTGIDTMILTFKLQKTLVEINIQLEMLNFNFKKLCFVCEYFANAFFIVHNKFFNFLIDVGSDDYNLSLAFKKVF